MIRVDKIISLRVNFVRTMLVSQVREGSSLTLSARDRKGEDYVLRLTGGDRDAAGARPLAPGAFEENCIFSVLERAVQTDETRCRNKRRKYTSA